MRKYIKLTASAASILTAISLCAVFTSCGKKEPQEQAVEIKEESVDISLEYDVSRYDMDSSMLEEDGSSKKQADPRNSSKSDNSSEDSAADISNTEDSTAETSEAADETEEGKSSAEAGVKSNISAPSIIPSVDIEVFGDKNEGDDVSLQNVSINGTVVNIRDETVDSLISKTGTKQNRSKIHYNFYQDEDAGGRYDGIFFFGNGYGIDSQTQDPTLRFTGTHFFIEGQRGGDELAMEVDSTAVGSYGIRCLYASLASTSSDFEVIFANGVKCGMDRSTVESLIGKGNSSRLYTYYANNNNVLFLSYSDDIVSEIYLVNDYQRLPVKYSPSEETETVSSSAEVESHPEVVEIPPSTDYRYNYSEITGDIHKVEE